MRQFPILYNPEDRKDRAALGWPSSVPWDFIAPYEKRAKSNHSQSLERLAQRGGLGPMEMYAVLRDIPYHDVENFGIHNDAEAIEVINFWVKEWLQGEEET